MYTKGLRKDRRPNVRISKGARKKEGVVCLATKRSRNPRLANVVRKLPTKLRVSISTVGSGLTGHRNKCNHNGHRRVRRSAIRIINKVERKCALNSPLTLMIGGHSRTR